MQFVVNGRTFDNVRDAENYEAQLRAQHEAELQRKKEKVVELTNYLYKVGKVGMVKNKDGVHTFIVLAEQVNDNIVNAWIYQQLGVPCTLEYSCQYVHYYDMITVPNYEEKDVLKNLAWHLLNGTELACTKHGQVRVLTCRDVREKLISISGDAYIYIKIASIG